MNHRVDIRISDEEKTRWRDAASKSGFSLSEWLRDLGNKASAVHTDVHTTSNVHTENPVVHTPIVHTDGKVVHTKRTAKVKAKADVHTEYSPAEQPKPAAKPSKYQTWTDPLSLARPCPDCKVDDNIEHRSYCRMA